MENDRVRIRQLPTGVLGLDEILGGGLPEFSFNIIAGAPGSGKSTLAHQFVFANATSKHPALYFTVLGEPALKMLRYQQQYNFFDGSKLNSAISFINLSQVLMDGGLEGVLEEIAQRVETLNARIVVVDSFRTLQRMAPGDSTTRQIGIQRFVQRLGLLLASWEATTFLIGEYQKSEMHDNPIFTIADGLFWLSQNVERNAIVRKLQIIKLRGQASVPGLHTVRITAAGLQAFSRTLGLGPRKTRAVPALKRLSIGVPALDEMLGGGIPEGDSILIAGPSGTGKSILATEFIAAGIRAGEPGIVAVFEERPEEYASRAAGFGIDLQSAVEDGTLKVIYLGLLDLSVDEAMQEILDSIKEIGAKRLVIDSLAGFEIALAPGFRADFRESLYRMIFSLTGLGVTILSTLEMEEKFTELLFSNYSISFLTDDIIRLRYIEVKGQLRKILMVIKMRGGAHSIDIREYEITSAGLVVGERLAGYDRLITGIPERASHPLEGKAPPSAKISLDQGDQ